ncbi:PREDICTED: interferon alpha-10-like [Ceratotherium simum simum]|uniref:Interferon alpha-10-like n=1 Tax=Ceratotherium simum simum TaxID=73337 RepID=A0ABM0HYX2_CERSS|nr:PREDICTED: interferon alpha-10-like [Ceratotherium simum simum]
MTPRMMLSSSVCTRSCDLAQNHGLPKQEACTVLDQWGESPFFSSLKDKKCFQVPPEAAGWQPVPKAQATSLSLRRSSRPSASSALTAAGPHWTGSAGGRSGDQFVREMGEEKSLLGSEGSSLAVKRYFPRTSLHLRKKEYSCGAQTLSDWKLRSESQSVLPLCPQVSENPGSWKGDLDPVFHS